MDINVLAMIGFLVSAITYLTHAFEEHNDAFILIGMTVITTGYVLLFVSKYMAYQKRPNAPVDTKTSLQYLGYGTLALFFIGTFFFRKFTIHYRFYDVFGGIGYFLMMLTKYIPIAIPLLCIVLYYFFGCVVKIWDEGWVNKAQLIARALLVIYYGASLMSATHLLR